MNLKDFSIPEHCPADIRCGDTSDIQGNDSLSSQPTDLLKFNNSQELRLSPKAHITDLIQK